MATLAEQRRAIGAAMETSRRAIGQNNADARRAIGTSMEAQRRGRGLVDDLNSVVTPTEQGRVLSTLAARGSRSVDRGVADYKAPTTANTGGIASPLVEKTKAEGTAQVPDRDYYADGLTSSDGLLILPAIKTLRMTDANGADVEFQLANPKGTL